MTPRPRNCHEHRRTVARWLDGLIRHLERRTAAPVEPRPRAAPPRAGRPPLRLRRDLNLVLGL